MAHTIVVTVTYDTPVTDEMLQIWEDTTRPYQGVVDVSAKFGDD